ncbi:MAG: FapA family protein [bacterium]
MCNNSKQILIIESNPDYVYAIRKMLKESRNYSFNLESADNIGTGLDLLNKKKYDAAIIDLFLSDSQGLNTYKKIRDQLVDLPVIVLTAIKDEELAVSVVQKGAQDYLIKDDINSDLLTRSILYAVERFNLQKKLEDFHNNTNQKLKNLNEKLDTANKRFNSELNIARNVQQGLYPRQIPHMDGLEIAADLIQARAVGGDYYDIIPLNDHEMAFLVADVSGHDISAAFIVGMAKISFLAHIAAHSSLAEVFKHVNEDMLKVIKTEHFLTAFLAVINTQTRILRYAKAGHFNQVIFRSKTGKIQVLTTDGMLLGSFKTGLYEEKNCKMDIGDKVILFTDGLFERKVKGGKQYGQKRLCDLIIKHGNNNAEKLHKLILQDQAQFCEGMIQEDDTCLLVAELRECSSFSEIKSIFKGEPPSLSDVVLNEHAKAREGIKNIISALEENNYPDYLISHYKNTLDAVAAAFQAAPPSTNAILKAFAKINGNNFKIVLNIDAKTKTKENFFTTGSCRNALIRFNRSFGRLEIFESGNRLIFSFYKKLSSLGKEEDILFSTKQGNAYITVPKNISPLRTIESVKEDLLKKNIVNANFKNIEKELIKKSGVPVIIGPVFEHFKEDKNKLIRLSLNQLSAEITLEESDSGRIKITRDDINFLLMRNKVCYGIKNDIIEELISGYKFNEPYQIACGQAPVNGRDAVLKECVNIDPTLTPNIKRDGSVNHKMLDLIKGIEAGAIIMEKIPAAPGKPGKSIFGMILVPMEGKDKDLPVGENTEIINNGTALRAKTSGYLYRNKTGIHVRELYYVKGNVDYSTGNLLYAGDVLVSGDVLSGFKIDAGGNILIEGQTEAAEVISRKGNIEFIGGVLGKGRALISASGNITADFIQEAGIKCGGILKIRKSLLHAKAEIKGDIIVGDKNEGLILGGEIICKGSIRGAEIGSSNQIGTSINMLATFDDPVREKLVKTARKKNEIKKLCNSVKSELHVRSMLFKLKAKKTQEEKLIIRNLLNKFYILKQQLEDIHEIQKDLAENNIREIKYGNISVLKTVYPNVTVKFGKIEEKISMIHNHVKILIKSDKYCIEPLS